MYELQQKEQVDKWRIYNKGIESFKQGHFNEALEYFEQYQSIHIEKTEGVEDKPCAHMIEKCQDRISKDTKPSNL